MRQGQMLDELFGHKETVNCCTVLPANRFSNRSLVATSSNDTTVRIWDLKTKGFIVCTKLFFIFNLPTKSY